MDVVHDFENLVDLFEFGVKEHRNPKLLNFKLLGNWICISADEAEKRVKTIALGLFSLGLRRGDRIAILADSSPDWALLDLASLSIGIVDVPIYTTHTLENLEIILSNSEPSRIMVAGRKLFERFSPAFEKLKLMGCIVSLDPNPLVSGGATLADLEAAGRKIAGENPALYEALKGAVKRSDLATIVYTSNEKGEPKGAMLSHGNLISNVIACAGLFDLGPSDTALSFLPLAHVFERSTLYHYLYRQVTVYFAESIEKTAADLALVRPTLLTTVPRLLEKIEERLIHKISRYPAPLKWLLQWAMGAGYQHDPAKQQTFLSRLRLEAAEWLLFRKIRGLFGGRIRHIISGGAWLKPDLARWFTAAGIPVLQGYGLTETSPVIAVNRPGENEIGSVGRVIPGVEVKISYDGEILVRGPNVMQGYYRSPKATREAFEDGWFKTGDVGFLDYDGFLFVIDRKKDLFKTSGGKYIAPQAIEKRFKKSPYIDLAVVIGEGKKFAAALIFPNFRKLAQFARKNRLDQGENPAQLIRHPMVTSLYEGVVKEVNKQLPHWETIKKFALIGEAVSAEQMSPSLKMRRKFIEQRYRDIVDTFYP